MFNRKVSIEARAYVEMYLLEEES